MHISMDRSLPPKPGGGQEGGYDEVGPGLTAYGSFAFRNAFSFTSVFGSRVKLGTW